LGRAPRLTITSSDADSVLDPDYFRQLTREFITCPKPENTIWQTPIFYDQNIWLTPASVRLLTFFNNAVQISELSNPFSMTFPLSTYSLSFKLVVDVGYWDPIVISEDWHMFLRCFFAKDGDMTVHSIFLPTTGEPFLDETTIKTWRLLYRTRVRHAWGAGDMVYMLQQWNHQPRPPFLKKLSRYLKIWHDSTVFSLGGVFVAVGTLLSVLLDNNPVITYPPFPVPYVIEALNVLGVVGMLTIWIVERFRCNNRKYSWRLSTIFSEIASWVIFPLITFVLASLPMLHAHTKMLLGSNLTFERTPKGILPKNHS
jgi:cellulose synthase/poly-beta-1,6-N-acetylglucosamine synthase-like glycosyltransferase